LSKLPLAWADVIVLIGRFMLVAVSPVTSLMYNYFFHLKPVQIINILL
jgi:hypothetical protein